jgi:hypothetical protein
VGCVCRAYPVVGRRVRRSRDARRTWPSRSQVPGRGVSLDQPTNAGGARRPSRAKRTAS